MGEFCCNIVANFVKGSAAKLEWFVVYCIPQLGWRFQTFFFFYLPLGRWSKLIQVNFSLFLFQLDWNHQLLPPRGKESPESLTNKLQIDQRTKARYLLAMENRPLEKIRKGDPHWKPSILLSMLVFGVYESQYRSAMLLQLHTVALLFDFPCPVAIMVNIPVISMVM